MRYNSSYFPLIVVALIFSSNVLFAQEDERHPLPRWMTPEEREALRSYIPPPATNASPPPRPVRALAEFEELEGIVIRWAFNTQNLLLSQIVDAAQDEGTVWILVRPGTSDSTNIKNYLGTRGIPLTNLEFLTVSTNSIWDRDYGPWTVYDSVTDSMAIVDFRYNRPRPLDDVVPVFLAQQWGLPLYQTVQMPDSLIHAGGNFMVDGFGTAFASKLIHYENPFHTPATIDSILLRYCGVQRFITMDTLLYDAIHHIDMHMKLLDEETLLIGQYPVNVSDYTRIENTVAYLRTLNNCYGRPYRIVRIPMPPNLSGQYPPQSYYLTYTNSVIVNKTVLVPIYNLPADNAALQIYRDAMPGYRILGFDCNSIIPQFGAIHCITKEVGVREPVLVAHARLWEATDTLQNYRIEATITVRSGVDSAFVYWRADTTTPFIRIVMTDSGGLFSALIPQQTGGTNVSYYIEAMTGSGRRVTKPLVGRDGPYVFSVASTTTSVSEGGQPHAFSLAQNYPNPFNPKTTIQFSVGTYGHTSLRVYDVLGREVATLVNQHMKPGTHEVTWDASLVNGTAGFASGVYFYRLKAGTFSQTRKLLILR